MRAPRPFAPVVAFAVCALALLWASATRDLVHLAPVRSIPAGVVALLAGAVLSLAVAPFTQTHARGDGALRYGVLVSFVCVGLSLITGSASGLWLVSPLVIACAASLAIGLRHRAPGDTTRAPTPSLLRIPAEGDSAPTPVERLSVFLFVLAPWLILYEAVILMGAPSDAIEGYFAFERSLPVIAPTEVVYASVYVGVLAAHVVAPTRSALRAFALRGLVSMAAVFPLFFFVPMVAPPRAFVPHDFFGRALAWERAVDTPNGAFPSFHVVWAALAAEVFAARWPRARHLARLWAVAVSLACLTTGMHALVDVLAGALVAVGLVHQNTLWERLRRATERVANSWHEWRIGPVRIISHGVWAGLAVGVGCAISVGLAGPPQLKAIALAAVASIVGAGLWAQLVEGSPELLRPYGYYGGVLGIIVGSLAAPLAGGSSWLLLAAFSVAGPWTQALGRMRCLVQGCCHGHESPTHLGIRYTHPRSRVCRLAHLAGVPVHPTPLYSILWNALLALVLARLWWVHAPLHLIAGLYLMLTGIGRFPEEAFRGEPQTPGWLGLRLYQWIAIVTVLAGATVTALGRSAPAPTPAPNITAVLAGLALGALGFFSMGVDFPESDRRFSRLA